MRPFQYRCPNPKCRVLLSIPESMRGRSARCGSCSQEFVAPFIVSRPFGQDKPPSPPLRKAS